MTRLTLPMLLSILLLTSATSAIAQPAGAPPPPPPPGYGSAPTSTTPLGVVDRRGFIIGFSLGGGAFSLADCGDCDTLSGLGLDIHLGGMLTPRLALMFDGSGVAHAIEGGGTIVHVIDTAAAQYWITPRVWIKGGLGIGQLSVNDDEGNRVAASETGAGVLLAGGVELVQTRGFALDLQLRASAVNYDDADTITMSSLNLGFNWY